jgi:asparagine synthase (glutamine-hydrolysing)
MPGITGIISKTQDRERELDQMIRCMLHEPFYNSGKYVNHSLGVYVGWTCHKGSFSDCMPIWNETGDVVLFFAGEHFGDKSEVPYLKGRGHEVSPSLGASCLVHLYEEKGEGFLIDLNGFFHGLVVDLRSEKAFLFNDRYGMQRVYFYEGANEVLFSSEAKSILKIRLGLRDIRMESLGEFLSCGCVLENKTLFNGIFLMPGGSVWTFGRDKSIKKRQYFKPEDWENQSPLDEKTFYYRLKETFTYVLPRYFSPEGKVGLSLTGGVDTRMMLACIDIKPGSLPCYTFGGPYRDSFDVKVSRKIAHACGQSHSTVRLDNTFISGFPELAERVVYITDGCLEMSGTPNLYVNRLARELAPIRLTGNYGQEVLRRYIAFRPSQSSEPLFNDEFLQHVRNARHTYDESVRGHRLSFALFKQAPWYQYPRLSAEQSQMVQRSPYMDNDLVKLVYQAPKAALENSEISLRIIRDGNPRLAKIATDRGVMGELAVPLALMARAYYEFLFKMEYYYNHGMPQWMASIDNSLRWLDLEKQFLGRHKYYHLRRWFREDWSNYLKDVLLSQKSLDRAYLRKSILNEMVTRHVKGDRNFTDTLSIILTVELLYRLLIDNS